jgi:hypothetical protein
MRLVRLFAFVVALAAVAILAVPSTATAAPTSVTSSLAASSNCAFLCVGQATTPSASGCSSSVSLSVFSGGSCTMTSSSVAQALAKQGAWPIDPPTAFFISQVDKVMASASAGVADHVLGDELGDKRSFNSPALIGGSAGWFAGQASIMEMLALYFVIPLLMVVVIQSVIRGSLFFLLRAVFIMLPVAIVGGIAVVAMAQLFLNITDDMSGQIAQHTLSLKNFGSNVSNTIKGLNAGSMGMFIFIWLFMFMIGTLGLFVELVLRQVGVYLAVLFLPLAFAALVWPPATRYARRLSELGLGLIFSKFFIVLSLSLGLAAFGHAGTSNGATTTTNGPQSKNQAILSTVMPATVVIFISVIATGRLLSWLPSATGHAEGHIMNRANATNRGNWLQGRLVSLLRRRNTRLQNIQPRGPARAGPGAPGPAPAPTGGRTI